jgi:hypothetical protein
VSIHTSDGFETSGRLQIGRVINHTVEIIGGNLATVLILSLGICALPSIIMDILTPVTTNKGFALWLGVATAALLQASLIHTAMTHLSGGEASPEDGFKVAMQQFMPLVGLSFLLGLAIVALSLLLIVPGIIASIAWSVAVPALVVERTGVFAAFGRSAELTRGSRWSIFALCLVMGAVMVAVVLVQTVIVMASGGATESLFVIIVSGILQALVALVGGVGGAALYYELRHIREGVGAGDLASVFD